MAIDYFILAKFVCVILVARMTVEIDDTSLFAVWATETKII